VNAASAARAPPGRVTAILTVCFAIAALEGYDIQTLGIAAPSLGPGLHLSLQIIGMAASVTMAAMGVGALIGGWLADRFGCRLVLVASVGLFGAAMFASLSIADGSSLILARLFTGLGMGGAMPNLIAMAAEVSPVARRSRAITSVSVGLPLGAGICSLIEHQGLAGPNWRGLFLIGGLLTLPTIPLAAWLFPGTRQQRPSVNSSVYHLFGEGRWAASLLLWVAICLTMTILSVMTTWLPTLIIHKGLSQAAGSLAAVVFNLVGVTGGLTLGRLIDRVGFRYPLTLVFVGLVAAASVLATATGLPWLLAGAGLAGFMVVGAQFGLYALFPQYYLLDGRSTGSGAGVAAGRVGSVVGPGVAGLLLNQGAVPGEVLAALIPSAIGAGLAAWALASLARPLSAGAPGPLAPPV
jgi:MFS transporter, AAHS family, 3-hydroxyphenylpropionic acid transporter